MKSTVEKVALIVFGIIIFVYAYYIFYLSDQLVSINTLRKDIDSTRQSIHKLENERKTINAKIEQEKNQSSEVNDAVPNIFDKKEIIKYFYELIKNDGLKSDKVALNESSGEDYQIGTVGFKVTGDYKRLRSFMNQVENDKRKFVIKQLDMSADGDSYGATLVVEYYALKQELAKP